MLAFGFQKPFRYSYAMRFLAWLLFALFLPPAMGATPTGDPLGSARWGDMRKLFFPDARVVFDPRVQVTAPAVAEDPMNVPVKVAVEALRDVREVVVFADFNPILKVLSFTPGKARPALAFRIKLQQSTPVRAAARTGDGVWHVGGVWVETTGGGCTLPSAGRGEAGWEKTLGQVSGRVWEQPAGGMRVRARVIHPMDTGLAPGIPAFYISRLTLSDEQGASYMEMETFEPVSENPVFTFDIGGGSRPQGALTLTGVDNNGNRIDGRIAP